MSISSVTSRIGDQYTRIKEMEEEALLYEARKTALPQISTPPSAIVSPEQNTEVSPTVSSISSLSGALRSAALLQKSTLPSIPAPSSDLQAESVTKSPLYLRTLEKINNSELKTEEILNHDAKEISFEELFQQVMLTLIHQTQGAVLIQKEFMKAEREWQNKMHEELMKSSESLASVQRASSQISSLSKYIGPLSMIAGGAVAIATGGVSILAAGAVALGGLITVDALMNDALKKTVAGWLSKANNESQEAWLARIHLFSSISSLVVGLGLSPAKAIQIATNVAQIAANGARTGVEWREKTVQALHEEIEHHLEFSGKMREKQIASLKDMGQLIIDLYKSIQQVHKSSTNACISMARRA